MKLNRYFLYTTFLSSVVTIVLSSIYSINQNIGYESEWFTEQGVNAMDIIFATVYCVLLSVLSLPILLNKIKQIRSNRVFRFLCWYLLPIGFILLFLIHEINFSLKYNYVPVDYTRFILLIIPFVIGLTWTYLLYVNDNNKNNSEEQSTFSHLNSNITFT